MDRIAKALLEGIQNNLANTHKYPWVGLDENKQLTIVFENTAPFIKEFELALQHLAKHEPNSRTLYSLNHFQEFTQFNLTFDAESLHNLLIKENAYYAQHHHQGSILSILYPNRPNLKIDAICITPIHPDTQKMNEEVPKIPEIIAVQLDAHLKNAQKTNEGYYHSRCIENIIKHHQGLEHIQSIVQELTGPSSLTGSIQRYGMHPDCQLISMTEEAKFIYANHTAIPNDELENCQSLEVTYEKFMSHFIDKLKSYLHGLEVKYENFISKSNPDFIIAQLKHEKKIYSEQFKIYQNHSELNHIKQELETLAHVLYHMNVFEHLRTPILVDELSSQSLMPPNWQEKLYVIYQKILTGKTNGQVEFASLKNELQNSIHQLKRKMQMLENELMRPLRDHMTPNHLRTNFFEHSQTPHFDQQRLKQALDAPYEIPQIINQLDKLIEQHRSKFEQAQTHQISLISELKTHIEEIERILTPPSLAFRHKS